VESAQADRPRVLVSATADPSDASKPAELEETIAITSARGAKKKAVMSLGRSGRGPSRMPDLAPGDRLQVLAEAEVTTDCEQRDRACVGNPYTYSPVVQPRVLLAASKRAAEPPEEGKLIKELGAGSLSHKQHHRVIVFSDAELLVREQDLPGRGERPHVNLSLDAHHRQARRGHKLLIGENEPDGSVGQDKGRLCVVRLRGSLPRLDPVKTTSRRAKQLPIAKGVDTVVYSLPLAGLKGGEQLAVRARMATSTDRLDYWARVSTRLVLADDPAEKDVGERARKVSTFRGAITERNGFNCSPGDERCITWKVGVLRIRESADKRLFVNLVSDCGARFGEQARGDTMQVLDDGFIEVVRYPPELRG
jgi:hypothetical protein